MQANQTLLWWMGVGSVLMFIATLIIVPILIIQMPADYFAPQGQHKRQSFGTRHPIIQLVLILIKNGLGVVLILAGLAMLLLPGQGILTLLIGLSLLDFPGKYDLERRIVQQPAVHRSINWIRLKANRPVLVL